MSVVSFAVKLVDRIRSAPVRRRRRAKAARRGSGKLAAHLAGSARLGRGGAGHHAAGLSAKLAAEKKVTAHPASLSRVLPSSRRCYGTRQAADPRLNAKPGRMLALFYESGSLQQLVKDLALTSCGEGRRAGFAPEERAWSTRIGACSKAHAARRRRLEPLRRRSVAPALSVSPISSAPSRTSSRHGTMNRSPSCGPPPSTRSAQSSSVAGKLSNGSRRGVLRLCDTKKRKTS